MKILKSGKNEKIPNLLLLKKKATLEILYNIWYASW